MRYVPGLSSGSEVDVPLIMDGRPIGVLVVESERPDAFGKADLEILTVAANQASIAIARARLLENQHRLLGQILERSNHPGVRHRDLGSQTVSCRVIPDPRESVKP